MELKDYLGIIKRRFITFLLVIALVCIANGVYATQYLRPTYEATAQIKILRSKYDNVITRRGPLSPGEVAEIIDWFQLKINIMNDRIVSHTASKLKDGDEHKEFRENTDIFKRLLEEASEDYKTFREKRGPDYNPELAEDEERFKLIRIEKFIRNSIKIGELKDPTTQLPSRLVDLKTELPEKEAAIHLVNALAIAAEEYHSEEPEQRLRNALKEISKEIGKNKESLGKAEDKIEEIRAKTVEEYKNKKLPPESEFFEEDYSQRIAELRRLKSTYRKRVKTLEEEIQVFKQMITRIGYKVDQRTDSYALELENEWKTTGRLQIYRKKIEALKEGKTAYESGTRNYKSTHPKIREFEDKIILLEDMHAEMILKEIAAFRGLMYQQLQNHYMDTDLYAVRKEVYTGAIDIISSELGILKSFNNQFKEQASIIAELKKEIYVLNQQEADLNDKMGKVRGLLVVNDVASGSSVNVKNPLPITGKGWGLCILIAMLVSIFIVYFLEYIDTRITTEYDIRRHLNVSVIGVVPHVSRGNVLLTEALPTSPMAEIFNTTATLLRSVANEKNYKNIIVCSALPREGKTSVSLNLSIALARKGLNVLLVDTDLRLPQIHNLLGLPNNVGLSTILEQKLEEKQIINDILEIEETVRYNLRDYLLQTSVPQLPNLRVLPSGPLTQNPIHLIESGSMRGLVERLKREADIIIYDTPPVMKVADALSLATICDACIMVLGSGQIDQSEASWSKHLFNNVEADMIGVLLN
ncbi:MAG: polysaccharide biosynthesis tyrosine autokinase, partial [Planctomycetota bacterium]